MSKGSPLLLPPPSSLITVIKAETMAGLLRAVAIRGRELPRGLRIRSGTAEDEPASFDVMRRAMNLEMAWADHAAMRHHLRQSPGASFWVAEDAPRFQRARIVGYGRSIVRETVWCLTEFFVLPDFHQRGIGGALLNHCLAEGDRFGAASRLVLASQSPAADSLYIRRAGCIPRLPMLLLCGPADSLRVPPEVARSIADIPFGGARPLHQNARLLAEPLLLTTETKRALDTLDRAIVGYARPTEHAHWTLTMGGIQGASRLFRRASDGEIIGYAYLGAFGSGPALALEPQNLPAMLAHVAQLERTRSRNQREQGFLFAQDRYFALAGTNETVLHWLLDCGWRIVFQYLFMSTRPPGSLDRYVCYNPLYVL